MIVQENLTIEGQAFVRTYSNENRYVVRDGIAYEEAYDPAEFGRMYTEGDLIPADESEDENEATVREIVDILLGGAT